MEGGEGVGGEVDGLVVGGRGWGRCFSFVFSFQEDFKGGKFDD